MIYQTRFSNIPWSSSNFCILLGKVGRLFIFLILLVSLVESPALNVNAATITFTGRELLGSPEDTSISIKVVPDSNCTLYYQYGTSPGSYPYSTSQVSATASTPITVTLTGLTSDTHYYYRMQYSTDGGSTWTARSEHSFWTQRAIGSTFTFDITSDNHVNILLGNATNWTAVMNKVTNDNADFQLDLGDTFNMNPVTSQSGADSAYSFQYQFFNIASANTPLFIVDGNHEQVEGWHMTASTGYHLPALATNALKKYYLNPEPDSFYTGDSTTNSYVTGDGMLNDYYSWTWGDALFVVIDPYWFSTTKPYTYDQDGGESDTNGSGNIWDWTLGVTQYNWLVNTLSASSAKYKFIFSHQIDGSDNDPGWALYGRGGADAVKFGEWGGYNADGSAYAWSNNRPSSSGWGSNPIRTVLENNHVSAFFHGHDHQMAYEKVNGVVYQSCPDGSFTGYFDVYSTGGNSGETIWADSTQGPGYLRVTVGPSQAQVEFMRYNNSGTAAETYTISPFVVAAKARDDYDGDGKSDPVKYTPSTHILSYLKSSDGTWGTADMGTDVASYVARSDFDGDGKTDPAKFVTASNSVWYIKSSTSGWEGKYTGPGSYTYVNGGDYDGDAKTDPAIFLSTNAFWYLKSSNSAWGSLYEGPGTYTLVKGSDFDGDGKTDPAHFVTSNNSLWYQKSSTSSWHGLYLGPGTYSYVTSSDFDGDGKTDPATFNSSTNVLWYLKSSTSAWVGVYLGSGTFSYVAGCDFDGDGKTDPAEFVSSTHMLWYSPSSGGSWVGKDMGTGTYDVVN